MLFTSIDTEVNCLLILTKSVLGKPVMINSPGDKEALSHWVHWIVSEVQMGVSRLIF